MWSILRKQHQPDHVSVGMAGPGCKSRQQNDVPDGRDPLRAGLRSVSRLNGVTTQQLNGINPAITGYITHLHLATAGFIAATAIAAGGPAWYGVRDGLWWAWITAVTSPVLGLAVALPMHWMGHFNYDWVSHLG